MLFKGVRPQTIEVQYFDSVKNFPNPEDLTPNRHHLIIFDDCLLQDQTVIKQFFTRGRHSNADVIYLSQSYFTVDRRLIRGNCNMFFLFRQPFKSVQHLYRDHCSVDMTLEEFTSLCKTIWDVDHNFLTIDLTSSILDGKYRKNLSGFYICREWSGMNV